MFLSRSIVLCRPKNFGRHCLSIQKKKKKTECVVKTHDRSETFVLQGNIVIIHQSLLNSIFTTKLYILMKKINYKQR
jgi:ABC-type proline/glycine betaine transport system ATPase subunit